MKSATRAIVNAIIPLVKNKTFEEGRLVEAVNDALLIQNDMVSRGIEDISDYVAQRNLFEENKLVYLQSVVINWYLNQTVNQFKNALVKYNNSLESNVGGSIFGDALTPDQIFQSIFVDGTNQKIQSIFDKKEKTLEPSVSMSKESLNERINNLTLAMKYQDLESRIEIEKLIKNLQLALKYL